MDSFDDGNVTCSQCNGEGFVGYDICDKCLGEGKIDWVTNIMGNPKLSISSLRKIDFSKLKNYLIRVVEQNSKDCINFDKSIFISKDLLENFVLNHIIYDYRIISTEDHKNFEIYIKPARTIEYINLQFHIAE